MSRIDHVVVGVRDLEAAGSMILDRYGLEAQPGGSHTGAGTANAIVPVGGDQFLELLTVTDASSTHPVPRWLRRAIEGGDRLVALAIEPEDIEQTATRLNEPVYSLDRSASDGRRVGFRVTGAQGMLRFLPFFVVTEAGSEWRCGFRAPRHQVEPQGIRSIEYGGNAAQIRELLADDDLSVRVVEGRLGVSSVTINVSGGEPIEMRF